MAVLNMDTVPNTISPVLTSPYTYTRANIAATDEFGVLTTDGATFTNVTKKTILHIVNTGTPTTNLATITIASNNNHVPDLSFTVDGGDDAFVGPFTNLFESSNIITVSVAGTISGLYITMIDPS